MATSECKNCKADVAHGQNFCRKCGLRVDSDGVDEADAEQSQVPDDSWVDSYQEVGDVAKLAIPENFKEFSLEDLRSRVVQAIWLRTLGIDPYAGREASGHEVHQEDNNPIPSKPMEAARQSANRACWIQPDQPEARIQRWHVVWLNGLVGHLTLTSAEAKRIGAFLRRAGRIEPCDCEIANSEPSNTKPPCFEGGDPGPASTSATSLTLDRSLSDSFMPVRVLRVADAGGPYAVILMLEYVARGEFTHYARFDYGCDGSEFEVVKRLSGDSNAFSALSHLRDLALYGQRQHFGSSARSIDEAVAQSELQRRELLEKAERWGAEKDSTPSSQKRVSTAESLSPSPVPKIIAVSRSGLSGEDARRLRLSREQVWRYAAGKQVQWKVAGKTPAGYEYEVLTVDGVEELYPCPKGLDTSAPVQT